MGEKYRSPQECTGRHPQKESPQARARNERCNEEARIILRQASNLRIPEITTIFSISHRATLTELNNLLQLSPIQIALDAIGGLPSDETFFRTILENLVEKRRISSAIKTDILSCTWDEIIGAFNSNRELARSVNDFNSVLEDEFLGLIDASINGSPPTLQHGLESKVLFEVDPNINKIISSASGKKYLITPIQTLRTVSIQTGYRRIIGNVVDQEDEPQLVSNKFYNDEDERWWYPGVQSFGEGIFIRLAENNGIHFPMVGISNLRWHQSHGDPSEYQARAHAEHQSKNHFKSSK